MSYAFKLQEEGEKLLENARKFLLFLNLLETRNALELIGQALLRRPQTSLKCRYLGSNTSSFVSVPEW